MALDNCTNCPDYCLGNIVDSKCVAHDGESLANYLDLLEANDSNQTSDSEESTATTDDVVSKSIVRDTSNLCASQIIVRNFHYSLSTGPSTITLGWNLLNVRDNLPSGYRIALSRVRVTGNTVAGRNVIADSSSLSGGFSIGPNAYPITLDFLIRVVSPCGDIDMEKTIKILDTSKTGTFSLILSAKDLNPSSGEILLTDQLNMIESKLFDVEQKLDTMPNSTTQTEENTAEIENLTESIDSLENVLVDYVKNGGNKSDTLGNVINDIYVSIKSLQDGYTNLQIQIEGLQDQIDALKT